MKAWYLICGCLSGQHYTTPQHIPYNISYSFMQYFYAMPAHVPTPFYGYFQTPMQPLRAPNPTSSNIGSQNPNPLSSSAGAQSLRAVVAFTKFVTKFNFMSKILILQTYANQSQM